MAKNSDKLNKDLEQAALDAVRVTLAHPRPQKEVALLNLLSKDTSGAPQGGSMLREQPGRMSDRELIDQIMAKTGMSEEEAVKELWLNGGL